MSSILLILLFLLILGLGVGMFVYGLNSDSNWLMGMGLVVVLLSVIPLVIADSSERKLIIKNCEFSKGEIVEYEDSFYNGATKTMQTTTELYCLKDGKLRK